VKTPGLNKIVSLETEGNTPWALAGFFLDRDKFWTSSSGDQKHSSMGG